MRIAIVGSGAMGSLYGGLLAEAGHDVTLVDVWEEHVRALQERGLRLSDDDGERTIDVSATTDQGSVAPPDLAIVFVKSTHTATALKEAAPLLTDGVTVLSLQNGLGNPETIAEYVPERNVVAGVTTQGSTLEGPGHVFHAGSGPTTIGRYINDRTNDDGTSPVAPGTDDPTVATDAIASDVPDLEALAATFSDAGLPTTVSDSIRDDIWEKVLVNVGINAPTALGRVENGTLATTAPGQRLVEAAVSEAAAVARQEGCDVQTDIVDYALEAAEQTGGNASSMLQDVRAERKTEIDTIHGAVVDRAAGHGVDVPVNRTLADLVRLTEHGYEAR